MSFMYVCMYTYLMLSDRLILGFWIRENVQVNMVEDCAMPVDARRWCSEQCWVAERGKAFHVGCCISAGSGVAGVG